MHLDFLKKFVRGKGDLLLLLFLTLLTQWPLLIRDVWQTTGDTIFCQEIFYAFYNNFFFHGELARWLPYGTYGIQADYWQLISLTPAGYLTGLLGAALRIQNVFAVYKVSVLFELGMFLGGAYALCRKMFCHRSAVFLTCLGLLSTALWIVQISWNFHLVYLLPLIFWLLLTFFEKRRPHYFWLAGTVFILAQLGVPAYFITLHFLALLLFFLPLLIGNFSALTCFREKSRTHIVSWLILFFCAAVYLFFAFHMFDHILSMPDLAGGRDPQSYQVPLQSFLTYSGPEKNFIGFDKWLDLFFPTFSNLVCPAYVGFLSFVFVLYGVLHIRRKLFMLFAGLTLFFILFSAGDIVPVARLTYLLYPPIRYFRYLGNIASLIRLFLLILAGFGLDQFLTDLRLGEKKPPLFSPAVRLLLCGLFLILLWIVLASGPAVQRAFFEIKISEPSSRCRMVHQDFYYFFLSASALVMLLAQKIKSEKRAGLILCFFFALELLSYHNWFVSRIYDRWPSLPRTVTLVSNFTFQASRRLKEDINPRVTAVSKLIKGGLDTEAYNFMLFDKCRPTRYNNPHWSEKLADVQNLLKILIPLAHPNAMGVIGCETPKLRLVSESLKIRNEQEALDQIFGSPNALGKIILIDTPKQSLPEIESAQPAGSIKVTAFSFNQLRLEADVTNPQGAWMYYADAYHPGWRASVDGKRVPVMAGNMAFKAVRLSAGLHKVRLAYWDGWQSICGIMLALAGILFVCALFYLFLSKTFFTVSKS